MNRDPFYRDIERVLAGKLDPELFEQCAADVLRTIHPTLVPIRGGSDAGMDGAIAKKGGLPYPLVTTTSKKVSVNLERSLKSYVKHGGRRRSVVLATSQALTPQRRRSLEKAATKLGFHLLQIHDRPSFADLLYRDPRWCQELLGLTGSPPPLSVIPLPNRPLLGNALIGREEDMVWLGKKTGDLLIVGQPGVGKTFLLHEYAKKNGGLFVHTRDLTEIAAGLRSQRPSTLIVDDAHLRLDLLPDLRHLRAEMRAKFRIIADSWPGSRDEVARALEVPSAAVRTIELLTKDEMVEVVKRAGIAGPNGLIQEIVNQAEGKPGLAVTLANLCLQGDVNALAQGDALAQELSSVFGRLVGHDVRPLLAAFSAGGNAGMTMQAVADYLEIPLVDVRERAAKLAAGGVLLEMDKATLSVRPPPLRHVLLRDVFFRGATSMPIEPLVPLAQGIDDLTATVIGAQFRGAQVNAEFIHSLVSQCSSRDVWAHYARLGPREAEWIAAEHPEWLTQMGDACLDTAPDLGLPPLLQAAVGDDRSLNAHPGHPMRIIGDWVAKAMPGTPLALERRRAVLAAAERWLDKGGDPAVGLHALAVSLTPAFRRTESAPGSGRTITFTQGFLPLADVRSIREAWPRILDRLRVIPPEHWRPLRDIVESWTHGPLIHRLSDDLRKETQAFATIMLQDLASVTKDHPGFLHWAEQIADRLQVRLPVSLDPVFETLFPPRELSDWRKAEAEQGSRAMRLADEWVQAQPADAVKKMLWCEHEARLSGHPWPRWTPMVCRRIAELVQDPMPWLHAVLDGGGAADLVQPFLRKNIEGGADRVVVHRCLEDERQRLTTAITLLSTASTPPDLVQLALTRLDGGAELIGTACMRGEVPESNLLRLLDHPDDSIAAQAAIGEWYAQSQGAAARPSVREAWQRAILRCLGDDWALREIFKAEQPLAFEWLKKRLTENKDLWRYDETMAAALAGMGRDERRQLLAILHEDVFPQEIAQQLVGHDMDLFRELLQIPRLKPLHLAPLAGHPNLDDWAMKAEAALAAGYASAEIAEAAFGQGWSWTGNVSDMWNEWVKRFENLSIHSNEGIREIGRIGSAIAEERRDAELERERIERVRG